MSDPCGRSVVVSACLPHAQIELVVVVVLVCALFVGLKFGCLAVKATAHCTAAVPPLTTKYNTAITPSTNSLIAVPLAMSHLENHSAYLFVSPADARMTTVVLDTVFLTGYRTESESLLSLASDIRIASLHIVTSSVTHSKNLSYPVWRTF